MSFNRRQKGEKRLPPPYSQIETTYPASNPVHESLTQSLSEDEDSSTDLEQLAQEPWAKNLEPRGIRLVNVIQNALKKLTPIVTKREALPTFENLFGKNGATIDASRPQTAIAKIGEAWMEEKKQLREITSTLADLNDALCSIQRLPTSKSEEIDLLNSYLHKRLFLRGEVVHFWARDMVGKVQERLVSLRPTQRDIIDRLLLIY